MPVYLIVKLCAIHGNFQREMFHGGQSRIFERFPAVFAFFACDYLIWKIAIFLCWSWVRLRCDKTRKVENTYGKLNNLDALCGKLLMAARVASNRTSKRPTRLVEILLYVEHVECVGTAANQIKRCMTRQYILHRTAIRYSFQYAGVRYGRNSRSLMARWHLVMTDVQETKCSVSESLG